MFIMDYLEKINNNKLMYNIKKYNEDILKKRTISNIKGIFSLHDPGIFKTNLRKIEGLKAIHYLIIKPHFHLKSY